MANGLLLKLDASQHALVLLLVLENTLVLPLALMLLVKLQSQGTKIILASSVVWPMSAQIKIVLVCAVQKSEAAKL